MKDVAKVFVDGGVCGRNPSAEGGSWAYILLDEKERCLLKASGFVTPADVGLSLVTNNLTEFLAALYALEVMEEGWSGAIHTDSRVTQCRMDSTRAAMNGIPEDLQHRWRHAKLRLGSFTTVLLNGHPTEADILRGRGPRGLPVSSWNVLCDELCTAAIEKWRYQKLGV